MNDTGITRKIDELGRIVIPKEIRRTLGIKDGENMQIFVDQNLICLKKYSFFSSLKKFASLIIPLVYEVMGYHVFIFNNESILMSTVKVNFIDDNKLLDYYYKLGVYESLNYENIFGLDGYFYGIPIILSSDNIGYLVLYSTNKFDVSVKKFATFLVKLLVSPHDIE